MRKINLLYVITKLELGGAQIQLLSFISNLDRQRFNPFLFTARDGLLLPDALSIKGLRVKRSKFLERQINPFKDLLALWEIYRFIKRNNIDIVHTHSSKAGILGRLAAGLARVKYIIHTVHGWSFNNYQPNLIRFFFIGLERLAASFTNKLIAVSCYDRQKGLNNRIGQIEQYALIRYGIDYAQFLTGGQEIRKEELGINPADLVIGIISCFKPQKALQDFIKLAFQLSQTFPDLKFLLVGDGILRKKIEKLIAKSELQNKVILTGWRRDIPRVLSVIDIFVLTSLWEGLPVSILEAMASAKPVVATNTGGIKEIIIEGRNGFLVQPHDTKSLSERLTLLLRNGTLRKDMGQNARGLLNFNFSKEHMVKNTQDLYDSLFKMGELKERSGYG